MSKVAHIAAHPRFKTKAGRDFDAFSAAIDKAMVPDPKQINFLKIGRTDEEYKECLAHLARRNEERDHE